jgi:iron(III) transport system substrate-binding protein
VSSLRRTTPLGPRGAGSVPRRIMAGVLAAALAGGLAGCAKEKDATSASVSGSVSASGETAAPSASPSPATGGKLLVYSGRQEGLVGPVISAFEQATGIDVDVRYGDTAQLAAQLIEEGDRTDADVFFSQDGGALGALDDRGRLEAIPQNVLDKVPAEFRADNGHWIGTSGRSRVIVYDPKQLTEDQVPNSVLDLTDPKWKGKIGIAPTNASFQSFVTGLRVLKGDDAARDWLKGLKANDPEIYPNNIAVLNAAEDSIISVGLINHYYWFEQVAEEGLDKVPARLKFLKNGDPGALVNVAGAGVLKGSDQAANAQRFVEFLVGEQAQKEFSEHLKEYPLVAGVPLPSARAGEPTLPPLSELDPPDIDLSDLDTLEQTLAMLEEVGLT